jgi:hypothetical protein
VLFGVVLLPFVLIALAWHVLTLPGLVLLLAAAWWLRRRRGRRAGARGRIAAAAAGLAACVLATGAAHAQSDEFWTDTGEIVDGSTDLGPVEPSWIVGLQLGPYVPGIDAQFHDQAKGFDSYYPYRHMFGGANFMPELEVDRVVAHAYGQITAGGSIGFLDKKAHPYVDKTVPGGDRPIVDTDYNTFRMLPLTAQAGYRFTYLDDRFGIPIVPYAKGGLAYYLWWMQAPSGNFSYVGDDNCHPAPTAPAKGCGDKEKAAGGSMGLIGSIGLSLRAERIDTDAAHSMQDSGIMHAGFYAELQASWVDTFGSKNRLSVGDATWFAGVNFEF